MFDYRQPVVQAGCVYYLVEGFNLVHPPDDLLGIFWDHLNAAAVDDTWYQPPTNQRLSHFGTSLYTKYSLTDFDEIPSLQVGTIFCTKTFLQTLFLHTFASYIPSLLRFFFYWNSILRGLTMIFERWDLSLHWWCCSVGAMHLGADGSSLDQSGDFGIKYPDISLGLVFEPLRLAFKPAKWAFRPVLVFEPRKIGV